MLRQGSKIATVAKATGLHRYTVSGSNKEFA
jgi:hypothetical protein